MNVEMRHRLSARTVALLCVAAIAASLSACLSDPTQVRVIVNSNAPIDAPVIYRAWVREGAELGRSAADASLYWAQFAGRRASDGESFTVVPRAGAARDGEFSVLVEATSGALTVRRTARARFVLRRSTTLRVPLNFDCALATVGCTDVSVACTIQRLCEERGLTCGESARCVPLDVTPEPEDGGIDGASLTVAPRMDSGTEPDSASGDADASMDVPAADTCTRNCAGRSCGSDSCGGSCGTCAAGQSCNASGQCVAGCMRNCAGRTCGSDGCGGNCGTCGAGQTCNGSGQCVATCMRNCAGRNCGADGCGGNCGTCGAGQTCNASGVCVAACSPSCAGKRCGSDGCGGSCGSCPSGLTCSGGGTSCVCSAGCSGSSANCRDACGYSNTACRSQCASNRTCNLSTGNCDCSTVLCNGVCCPTGTLYCRSNVCCTDCGRPSLVCNIC
ncbi:MAG: hypothetical protein JNK05_36815 [Myxococcales bacterium]|nr:hypothetical protein [Myxococcales bacterium]